MVTAAQVIKRKRALKKYVKAHGGNPRGLNLAPIVGPVARKWIRWLERREWPKQVPTGRFDTKVLTVLFPPKPKGVGLRALEIGKSYVGTTEHPPSSNRGPIVDTFLAACGFFFRRGQGGVPWCGCYVTKCLRLAGWKGGGFNTAYVPAWVDAAHRGIAGLEVIAVKDVQAGDIACFDWGHDRVADHIGFTRGPVKDGKFPSREGNTSFDDHGDQSNGGCVADKERNVSDVICFIRVHQEIS